MSDGERVELEALRAWRDRTAPIIAALAIYGEAVNVASLVEQARALNERVTDDDAARPPEKNCRR
jgi:hypothetical protein